MKRTDTEQTTVTPFELKLPEPFDIKPVYSIEMPAKHTARIYLTLFSERDYGQPSGGKDYTIVKKVGWRIVVVNRQGVTSRKFEYLSREAHTNPLDVTLQLQGIAKELSKTKRTNTEEVDYED
jgi:hypothetical protein